ncbi:hypothetical protein ES705_07073 [subsurface metagenome]
MIGSRKINIIKRKISKEFPEFKGVEPKITEKLISPQDTIYRKLSLGRAKRIRRIFRLKFQRRIETADQVEIERILTVTLDEKGEIMKITESR